MLYFVAYSVIDPSTDSHEVIKRVRFDAPTHAEALELAKVQVAKLLDMIVGDDATWVAQAILLGDIGAEEVYINVQEWDGWGEKLDSNWLELTSHHVEEET
jgi:hypothetical protein